MNDIKASAAAAVELSLSVEVAAGTGQVGTTDGPLDSCSFRFPYALCQFDGSLFVADSVANSVREVTGVLGNTTHSEELLTAALLAVSPVLPKELARVMAQYTGPTGVRTIAGSAEGGGAAHGHALRQTTFRFPYSIAVDASDAEAGPQLLVADSDVIRWRNLRTAAVTTIAGRVGGCAERPVRDGPALRTAFPSPFGMTVAPNGVVFVTASAGSVRRISAPKRAAKGLTAERFVTTVIGAQRGGVHTTIYAASAAPDFRTYLRNPTPLISVPLAAGAGVADEKAAVRCLSAVRTECIRSIWRGERKRFPVIPAGTCISGLALDEGGARLFAVTGKGGLSCIDLQSGAVIELLETGGFARVFNGPADEPHALGFVMGAVYDSGSRSLIVCDQNHCLLRVRGL